MLSLDLRSLTIMAGMIGMIGIVMGLVLLGLRRSYPPSIRGMRLWGTAPLLCASSTLFYGLDGVLPAPLVALVGNALLLAGVTLFLLGSERLYSLPSSWRRWATVILGALLAITFFMFVYPDYRIRVLVFSGTLAAIVAEHARLLGRHGNRGFAPRFTAMVLWGAGSGAGLPRHINAVAGPGGHPSLQPILRSDPLHCRLQLLGTAGQHRGPADGR